jgi:hypothetical protein
MIYEQVPTQFPVSYRNPTTSKAMQEICIYCLRDFWCDWNPYCAFSVQLQGLT